MTRKAWNEGLTKETDERVLKYTISKIGKPRKLATRLKISNTRKENFKKGKIKVWNKDLTKETDVRLKKLSESIKKSYTPQLREIRAKTLGISRKGKISWNRVKRLKKKCINCGKEILVTKARMQSGCGKFCSKSCTTIYSHRNNLIKRKPNNLEKKMVDIIEKYSLPYKYVGNGKFWIEDVNPDFVNTNSKKVCIEVFGNYWHSPLINRKVDWEHTFLGRKKKLKEYGWECIIFWDNEINDKTVLERLKL